MEKIIDKVFKHISEEIVEIYRRLIAIESAQRQSLKQLQELKDKVEEFSFKTENLKE